MEDTLQKNNQGNPVGDPTTHVNPYPQQSYKEDSTSPEDLDARWLRWKCLKCGYLYEGVKELKKCPKCGNEDPDLFGDVD